MGIRGIAPGTKSKVNYFLLVEFGNNGITYWGKSSAKLTDASITLSFITGARIRIGQFKYPAGEEALRAIHVFDYINFANITNQLLLERYFNGDGSDVLEENNPSGPVGAFRDIGMRVFNTFKLSNWAYSYAVMVGNGNGLTRNDNDDHKDVYLYGSLERVFSGKRTKRKSLKLYAWYNTGKRTLITTGAGTYDRQRWGVGSTFRKHKYRAAFEYILAKGMILNGTDGAAIAGTKTNNGDAVASFNLLPKDEANGWYVDTGYLATKKLEIDFRYDRFNRGIKVADGERRFETVTIGTQYFFSKGSKIILNYEFRKAKAPNLDSSHTANKILRGMDNRFSLQFLLKFG